MVYSRITIYLFLVAALANNVFAQNSFVKQQQNKFILNNQPYHFIGANMWYANIIALADNKGGDRKRLLKELDFLKQHGVNNIRILVGAQGQGKIVNGVQPVHPPLQIATGKYNDDILDGMDFLLQQMEKRKIYGVFFFANNWEWSGGFLQYLNWQDKLTDKELAKKYSWDEFRDFVSRFYTCTECKNDYWNFVKHVLQRTNKITGRKYIAEPAIMAWEIANEPRPMLATVINDYTLFLQQTSAMIKKIDPNHLLTIGAEGYMGTETLDVFKTIHNDSNIDYATIHIWPKNWSWYKDSTFKNDFANVIKNTGKYINDHAAIIQQLNKPLVVEEFGLPRDDFSFTIQSGVNYRDKYFESVFNLLRQSKDENKVIAGVNFWSFSGFGKPAQNSDPMWREGDDLLGDPPMEEQGLNSVFASDTSTWKLIAAYAAALKK